MCSFVFLYLSSFTSFNVFKVHLCCGMYQYIITFYGWIIFHGTTLCLSILQLKDIWVTFWLLWIMLIWQFLYIFLCEHRSSVLLAIYLGVELLHHMVALSLIFWGTAKLFHSSCTILHSYQQCMRVPISLHHHQHLLLSTSEKLLFTLEGVKYLTVILICIFLITNDVEHFSGACWLFVYLLWRNVY